MAATSSIKPGFGVLPGDGMEGSVSAVATSGSNRHDEGTDGDLGMASTADFFSRQPLMGDPVRAQILGALMDGRALTASELTRVAGVAPQTTSGHLSKLADGGLISASKVGRFRYFRIAGPNRGPRHRASVGAVRRAFVGACGRACHPRRPKDPRLRLVRTCYDHLAGSLAVGMADSMVQRGYLEISQKGALLSAEGLDFLRELGEWSWTSPGRGPLA